MSQIVITGSRDWQDYQKIFTVLAQQDEATVFIEGGCISGADMFVRMFCQVNNREHITMPAHWSVHGKRAGPIRNAAMVAMGPSKVIAFCRNKSRGTTDCISKARNLGIPTQIFTEVDD